jgi:hypothetical protein
MAQVVSHQPLTTESRVWARSLLGFVVDKLALGQFLLQVLQFSPVNIIPPSLCIQGMNSMSISGSSSET